MDMSVRAAILAAAVAALAAPLLAGVPVIPEGEVVQGDFFPLLA